MKWLVHGPLEPFIRRALSSLLLEFYIVWGDAERLHIDATAAVNNALFNTISGQITVGPYAFFGHGVSVITGTHDYEQFGAARQRDRADVMADIFIGEGVWLASNVTVLGPAVIGPHAVVAAGAVVRGDVPAYAVVGGVPARPLRRVPAEHDHTSP